MASELQIQLSQNSIQNYFKNKTDSFDFMNYDFTKMQSGKDIYGSEWKYINASNLGLSRNEIFRIPRSDGFVGNIMIEGSLASAGAGLSWNAYVMCQAIDTITITIGKQIMQYSGEALFMYLATVNYEREARSDLLTAMTGATGAATPTGIIYAPIVCPGQTGKIGEHNIPFQIGACASDYEINIKWKAAAAFETSGASVVSAFSSLRLMYKRYRSAGNDGYIANIGSGVSTLITYKGVDLAYSSIQTYTMSTTAYTKVNLDSININGDVLWINAILTLNANVDKISGGVRTANMIYDIGNTRLYEHQSVNEGEMKHQKVWYGRRQNFDTSKYFYAIPFCPNPIDAAIYAVGTNGLNAYQKYPNFQMYGPTGASYDILLSSVVSAIYIIERDGRITKITTYDRSYPMPGMTNPETGSKLVTGPK